MKYIFKRIDKKTRHRNNQQAILVSCLKGKYTEHIVINYIFNNDILATREFNNKNLIAS